MTSSRTGRQVPRAVQGTINRDEARIAVAVERRKSRAKRRGRRKRTIAVAATSRTIAKNVIAVTITVMTRRVIVVAQKEAVTPQPHVINPRRDRVRDRLPETILLT